MLAQGQFWPDLVLAVLAFIVLPAFSALNGAL